MIGRAFTFGSVERLASSIASDVLEDAVRLELDGLPLMRSDDIILSPLPWSPLLDCIQSRHSDRRPFILRVADGFITQINSRKRLNRRDGGLYANLNGDCFVVQQNAADLAQIANRYYPVKSVRSIEVATKTFDASRFPHAVFVFGNDPRLDVKDQVILEALEHAVRFCGICNLPIAGASVPDARFRALLQTHFPQIPFVRLLKDLPGEISGALFISSPSTVALDLFVAGEIVVMLSCFSDPIIRSYFSEIPSIEDIGRMNILNLKTCHFSVQRRLDRSALTDLVLSIPKQRMNKRMIFRSAPRAFARDLSLLARPLRVRG